MFLSTIALLLLEGCLKLAGSEMLHRALGFGIWGVAAPRVLVRFMAQGTSNILK